MNAAAKESASGSRRGHAASGRDARHRKRSSGANSGQGLRQQQTKVNISTLDNRNVIIQIDKSQNNYYQVQTVSGQSYSNLADNGNASRMPRS